MLTTAEYDGIISLGYLVNLLYNARAVTSKISNFFSALVENLLVMEMYLLTATLLLRSTSLDMLRQKIYLISPGIPGCSILSSTTHECVLRSNIGDGVKIVSVV